MIFSHINSQTCNLIDSLSLQLVSQGEYEVYWVIKNKDNECDLTSNLRKFTSLDDIEKVLSEFDYVASD